ncbi:MAG: autorepressor SdpR family transcription factor [Bacteroidota bacterium]
MNILFKALNDPTRREILTLLRQQDLSAGSIAAHFNISKPSISHHLDLLKQAELVTVERKGKMMIYSLNTSVLEELLSWIMDLKS